MKKLYPFILFLFNLPANAQEFFFGFFAEDDKIVWECHFEDDLSQEGLREELFASLGSNSFVRLSPHQPKERIVGRVEGMPSRFKGLDNSIGWTYDFGFTITFTGEGYLVRGTNFVGKTNSAAFGSSSVMTAEEWLGRNGKSRQKKWCEANGIPATEIFQLP